MDMTRRSFSAGATAVNLPVGKARAPVVYFRCGLMLPCNITTGQIYTIGIGNRTSQAAAIRCFTIERHCQVFEEWPAILHFAQAMIAAKGYPIGAYTFDEWEKAPYGTPAAYSVARN